MTFKRNFKGGKEANIVPYIPNCSIFKKVSVSQLVSGKESQQYLDNDKIKDHFKSSSVHFIDEQILAFSRFNHMEQACTQWGVL